MSIFEIDTNNGFKLTSGTINRVTGIDAVVINCQHEAQVIQGEDPFNQTRGMPNFDTVWNGNPNLIQFEFNLRRVLLAVANVDSVSNFQSEIVDNVLSYDIDINTPFGTDTVSGSISF